MLFFKTETQKKTLLKKFNDLNDLNEKFDFWEDKLQHPYILFLLSTHSNEFDYSQAPRNDLFQFSEFRIIPEKEEYLLYNEKVLKQYIDFVDLDAEHKEVISFVELVEDFKIRLSEIQDKQAYIKQELENLSIVVANEFEYKTKYPYDGIGKLFKQAYEQFYFNNQEFDYSKSFYDYEQILALNNGKAYAEFKRYLEQNLEQPNQAAKISEIKPYSILVQLLIADYSGMLEQFGSIDNKALADELALFFNKNAQNVRAQLTDFNTSKFSKIPSEKNKIRKNLNIVLAHFQKMGNKKAVAKVKKDLQKLDQ